jgi:hypothetical protein
MGGRTKRTGTGLAAALCALSLILPAAAAAQSDPLAPNLDWTSLLPPLPGTPSEPQPGPVPHCEAPSLACIDAQIERMQDLRASLGCDHRGVFATTYLELTKEIRATVERDPGVVEDPEYLFTEDAVFANMYFDTLEAWEQGAEVPPAWRIAFDQAERGQITGAQEMLLGINAHVQNDMAFVLAGLGLRTPDGASRKPDHDAMNVALNTGYEAVVREVGARYDGTMRLTNSDAIPVDNLAGLELARTWRELVWRNAERLANAKTEAQRDRVARSIEANAAMWAKGIAATQVPGIRATRDAYCAANFTP